MEMSVFFEKEKALSAVGKMAHRLVLSLISGSIARTIKSFCQKYFKVSRKKIAWLRAQAMGGDEEGPFLVVHDGRVVGIVGGPPGTQGAAEMEQWMKQLQAQQKAKEGPKSKAVKGGVIPKGKR